MITDEQIKSLKPGDPLIIYGKFDSIFNDGDIGIKVSITGGYGEDYAVIKETTYAHPSCVSLPSVKSRKMSHTTKISETAPKYDPCRKFKEGDIVDYRRIYGRDYETVPDPEDYKFARVISSEDEESGMVGVEFIAAYGGEDVYFAVPWFHLELVIPVEELAPYSVHESEVMQGFDIVRDKLCVMTFPFGEKENGWYNNRLEAKAAAEAERDRLNAEWKTFKLKA
jgi:hypothetical protein